ncbi:hypothetical protein PIB30_074528 [Stylosanthes scabra]|uniref:Uncharacterized protein n=1 Tax=Stylosanthes scabra TaxID=79078 RepID=A0ABU6UNJ5_9FABA|nr:hypothetical protein [Stylosanthes scabra]
MMSILKLEKRARQRQIKGLGPPLPHGAMPLTSLCQRFVSTEQLGQSISIYYHFFFIELAYRSAPPSSPRSDSQPSNLHQPSTILFIVVPSVSFAPPSSSTAAFSNSPSSPFLLSIRLVLLSIGILTLVPPSSSTAAYSDSPSSPFLLSIGPVLLTVINSTPSFCTAHRRLHLQQQPPVADSYNQKA